MAPRRTGNDAEKLSPAAATFQVPTVVAPVLSASVAVRSARSTVTATVAVVPAASVSANGTPSATGKRAVLNVKLRSAFLPVDAVASSETVYVVSGASPESAAVFASGPEKESEPEETAEPAGESVHATSAPVAFSPSVVRAIESVAVRAARSVAPQSPNTGATIAAGSTSVRQTIW